VSKTLRKHSEDLLVRSKPGALHSQVPQNIIIAMGACACLIFCSRYGWVYNDERTSFNTVYPEVEKKIIEYATKKGSLLKLGFTCDLLYEEVHFILMPVHPHTVPIRERQEYTKYLLKSALAALEGEAISTIYSAPPTEILGGTLSYEDFKTQLANVARVQNFNITGDPKELLPPLP